MRRRPIIAGDDPETLASLGEFGLIAALSAWLPRGPRTLVGIGDDAAVLATPDGRPGSRICGIGQAARLARLRLACP